MTIFAKNTKFLMPMLRFLSYSLALTIIMALSGCTESRVYKIGGNAARMTGARR